MMTQCVCFVSTLVPLSGSLEHVSKRSLRGMAYLNKPQKNRERHCFSAGRQKKANWSDRCVRSQLLGALVFTKQTFFFFLKLTEREEEEEEGNQFYITPVDCQLGTGVCACGGGEGGGGGACAKSHFPLRCGGVWGGGVGCVCGGVLPGQVDMRGTATAKQQPLTTRQTRSYQEIYTNTGRERDKLESLFTFRVQGSGRIEVEVPAEKGDEVRGHRSPSSLEKPDTLTLSFKRDDSGS